MTEQLEAVPGMKILEIGTGSGYQAAILAHLGCEVYSIELLEELAEKAKKTFADLGVANVTVRQGNGYSGWLEEAPFDAIIVTAAPDIIPEALLEQIKDKGKMLIPVGKAHSVQSLKIITKKDGKIIMKDLLPVRFVPMVKRGVIALLYYPALKASSLEYYPERCPWLNDPMISRTTRLD